MECNGKGQTVANDIEQSENSVQKMDIGQQSEMIIKPQMRSRKQESQHEIPRNRTRMLQRIRMNHRFFTCETGLTAVVGKDSVLPWAFLVDACPFREGVSSRERIDDTPSSLPFVPRNTSLRAGSQLPPRG